MEPQTQKRKRPDADAAALCTNGCGFFGTAANKGMCSKCYRETEACQEADEASVFAFAAAPPSPRKKIKTGVPAIVSSSADAAAGGVDTSSSSSPAITTEQQRKESPANRCVTCRRKVGLTGFLCRCGGTFCGPHRYADAHSCGFDYKAQAREMIAKQNPVVVAPKLDKI